MGNKQEELEAITQQDGYDLVAITETWWDNLRDWHDVMDGYRLFKKDRPTRRGGGVALYVKEQLECIEPCLGANRNKLRACGLELRDRLIRVTLLWVCTTGHLTRKRNLMRASTGSLQAASQSQALVLMGDFNHPDISWEDHTARQAQSRRLLQNIDNKFLMQVVEEQRCAGPCINKQGGTG